jgi:hypothetical protein
MDAACAPIVAPRGRARIVENSGVPVVAGTVGARGRGVDRLRMTATAITASRELDRRTGASHGRERCPA